MKKRKRKSFGINLKDLFIRYGLLVLLGIPFHNIFYIIFFPLTFYPSYFLLNLFYNASISANIIFVNGIAIQIIGACVASSAYYLFFILNLSTPNIEPRKRVSMLLQAVLVFLFFNILRIFFLSIVYLSGSTWFDFTHEFFWWFVSVFLVVIIWFYQIKVNKIKDIPFYSDLKKIYNSSSLKHKNKPKASKKNK